MHRYVKIPHKKPQKFLKILKKNKKTLQKFVKKLRRLLKNFIQAKNILKNLIDFMKRLPLKNLNSLKKTSHYDCLQMLLQSKPVPEIFTEV